MFLWSTFPSHFLLFFYSLCLYLLFILVNLNKLWFLCMQSSSIYLFYKVMWGQLFSSSFSLIFDLLLFILFIVIYLPWFAYTRDIYFQFGIHVYFYFSFILIFQGRLFSLLRLGAAGGGWRPPSRTFSLSSLYSHTSQVSQSPFTCKMMK